MPAPLFGFMLGPFEMAVVGVIALLLFGSRLPSAMRGLGQSVTSFKEGMREGEADAAAEEVSK